MTKSKTIYFVTSNRRKFASLKKLLQPLNIDLRRLDYDFDEGRSLDIRSIAEDKLAQAKKAFPDKYLIVDDRGFFIPALKGFPGPFVKLLLDSFSYEGITKLMQGETIAGLSFLMRSAIMMASKIISSWQTKRALLSTSREVIIYTVGQNYCTSMVIPIFRDVAWLN